MPTRKAECPHALERGPFGQALSFWVHRFPRNSGHDWDWDIDRGFHLQVLSPSFFELNLRPRDPSPSPTLCVLPGASTLGVTRLLIWNKSPQDNDWHDFADLLKNSGPWRAGLILGNTCDRAGVIRKHLERRCLWARIEVPVVHIFQNSPRSESYFTVEKNLFLLARAGRRLKRYSKWRRLFPW